ncbi:unnamed protein product [Mytilus edulis]|uniref:Uncharacterized protein n=1 Tax=Mytilus edulis TaxID=6550 RepID=A0A8S3T8J0_MYTED|nr:unnamed protein product [Mytilus edulis]
MTTINFEVADTGAHQVSCNTVTSDNAFAQVTEDCNTSRIFKTIEAIFAFTGKQPKDASHIEDVKYMLETFPHPNLDGEVNKQDAGGTVPVNCDIFRKLTDWSCLPMEQQRETQTFLLKNYSVEDLQLAWDEYIIQKRDLPNSEQYRIFIINWRGNKTKRRTQSLADLMKALEHKDDEIYQERNEQQQLHSELNFVKHINEGHDLIEQNGSLTNAIDNLKSKIDMEVHVGQTKEQIIAEQSQLIDEQKAIIGERMAMIEEQKKIIEEQKEKLRMHKIDDENSFQNKAE